MHFTQRPFFNGLMCDHGDSKNSIPDEMQSNGASASDAPRSEQIGS